MLISANHVLEGPRRLGLARSCSPRASVQGSQKDSICYIFISANRVLVGGMHLGVWGLRLAAVRGSRQCLRLGTRNGALPNVKAVELMIVSNACLVLAVSDSRGQLLQLGIGKE